MKNGLQKIQDVQIGDEVLTSNGYQKVLDNIYQGEQSLIKITTQLGDCFCTPNHRMAVLVSPDDYTWKMAQDLTDNDYLVFNTDVLPGQDTQLPSFANMPQCKSPHIIIPELTPDIAWFLGYFHGNGNVYMTESRGEICVSINSDHTKVIDKVTNAVRMFGITGKIYTQGNCTRVKVQNKNIATYFSQFKKSWSDMEVPECILCGTSSVRSAYLAGLFDSDGTFNGTRLNTILSSTSLPFLIQVQSVYASLGIPVRHKLVKKAKKETHKDLHELGVMGQYSKNAWANNIGVHSEKFIRSDYSKHSVYHQDYHYPRNWFTDVDKTPSGTKIKSSFLSYDEYFGRYGNYPDFIPIKVINTELDNKIMHTFDLTVENEHEYFCGEGLLNHNSAEICLGDPEDDDFINLKNYNLNPERAEIGWMSNNSVVLKADRGYEDFTFIPEMANRIRDNGEPGMINLYNMQKYGRYGKELVDEATLVNPCGEIELVSNSRLPGFNNSWVNSVTC